MSNAVENRVIRDPRTGLITGIVGYDRERNLITSGRDHEYRDNYLFDLSMELHEVLFGIIIGQYKVEIPEDIEEIITSLQSIKSRLSNLMDEYENFEKEFVKPVAELRAKVISYIIYTKQWRSLDNVTS